MGIAGKLEVGQAKSGEKERHTQNCKYGCPFDDRVISVDSETKDHRKQGSGSSLGALPCQRSQVTGSPSKFPPLLRAMRRDYRWGTLPLLCEIPCLRIP